MRLFLVLFIFCLFISCTDQPDMQQERQALLRINEEQRMAHMTLDAKLLANSIGDSLLTVDSGQFYQNSNQEILDRFSSYFSGVRYLAWDDIEPPVIAISADASLATMSVRKQIITQTQGNQSDTTIFAWTSGFRKVNGEWKMYSISSTDDR